MASTDYQQYEISTLFHKCLLFVHLFYLKFPKSLLFNILKDFLILVSIENIESINFAAVAI